MPKKKAKTAEVTSSTETQRKPETLKGWPENGDPVGELGLLSSGIIDAVKQCHALVRKNEDVPITLQGPVVKADGLAIYQGNTRRLSRKRLKQYEQEQNRDLLTILIETAVLRGVEQGKRAASKDAAKIEILFDATLAMLGAIAKKGKIGKTEQKQIEHFVESLKERPR